MGFSVREILEATGAQLIAGNPNDYFAGVSIDSRTVKRGDIFICIKGERFDGGDFISEAVGKGALGIIISRPSTTLGAGDKAAGRPAYRTGRRGPANIMSVGNTVQALSQLAHTNRKRFDVPIVAITGSNGKTTTKEMLSALLSAKYKVLKNEGTQNNIIGLSLSLLRLNAECDLAVLELGTNHFGELKELTRIAAPNVGIITNVGPAHLESFGDESGVLKEKLNLLEGLSQPRIAILNADDNLLKERLSCDTGISSFTFGIKNRSDFMARRIICKNQKTSFLIKNYPIKLNTVSRVNVYNALCAYATARIFGIEADDIIKKFQQFSLPDARFQIKKINGLNVIDDCYNANPASFHQAIESFNELSSGGRKIVVIADMLELGQKSELLHRELGRELGEADVDLIIAVGRLSHIACDAAKSSGFNSRAIYKCFSTQEARGIISGLLKKDDTVLIKGSRAMRLEEIFNNKS